jgi:hypothetical protein
MDRIQGECDLNIVCCQQCGCALGRYKQIDDKIWIVIGSVVLSSAHGRCIICGVDWHWVGSDKKLEEILDNGRMDHDGGILQNKRLPHKSHEAAYPKG